MQIALGENRGDGFINKQERDYGDWKTWLTLEVNRQQFWLLGSMRLVIRQFTVSAIP